MSPELESFLEVGSSECTQAQDIDPEDNAPGKDTQEAQAQGSREFKEETETDVLEKDVGLPGSGRVARVCPGVDKERRHLHI